MICLPCVPSLAAIRRNITFNEQPEIMHVYVPVIVYGRTHKHSLKRARRTHEKIRNNKAQPAYSSKTGSAEQVWMDKAVECLVQGSSYMGEYSFKQMDPKETETAVGENSNPDSNYRIEPTRHPGCHAPRKIIADTGAAVDLIGARDIHAHDRQRRTAEPIHFCTANGNTKADTIVQ